MKPASIVELETTSGRLKEHFGEDTPIDEIAADAANDWLAWLRTLTTKRIENDKVVDRSISEATIRKYIRNAKTVFAAAVERETIERNPFAKLKSAAQAAVRGRYVTPDEADTILEQCPDVTWKALFGLARYAGLRCPSETHRLTWGDVDWEQGRLTVRSPKTERYERHRQRIVPMTPKLRSVLQDAFDVAEEGQERVVMLCATKSYLRTRMQAVKRMRNAIG